ncbi:hypothetical protein P7K49_002251 [Saguinus oedipus]|uniref:Basic proline-rich protein-like n=1 Tax=Saguinus oedipus TaxID=9490 RepID=A0ABQ9WHD7_SAGOE|nr:hypothetical protein P7K49_002251 [Saguinus oedipus]
MNALAPLALGDSEDGSYTTSCHRSTHQVCLYGPTSFHKAVAHNLITPWQRYKVGQVPESPQKQGEDSRRRLETAEQDAAPGPAVGEATLPTTAPPASLSGFPAEPNGPHWSLGPPRPLEFRFLTPWTRLLRRPSALRGSAVSPGTPASRGSSLFLARLARSPPAQRAPHALRPPPPSAVGARTVAGNSIRVPRRRRRRAAGSQSSTGPARVPARGASPRPRRAWPLPARRRRPHKASRETDVGARRHRPRPRPSPVLASLPSAPAPSPSSHWLLQRGARRPAPCAPPDWQSGGGPGGVSRALPRPLRSARCGERGGGGGGGGGDGISGGAWQVRRARGGGGGGGGGGPSPAQPRPARGPPGCDPDPGYGPVLPWRAAASPGPRPAPPEGAALPAKSSGPAMTDFKLGIVRLGRVAGKVSGAECAARPISPVLASARGRGRLCGRQPGRGRGARDEPRRGGGRCAGPTAGPARVQLPPARPAGTHLGSGAHLAALGPALPQVEATALSRAGCGDG